MKEQGFEKMVITFTTGILLRPSSIGIENTNQIGGIRTKVSKGENESVKTKIQKCNFNTKATAFYIQYSPFNV